MKANKIKWILLIGFLFSTSIFFIIKSEPSSQKYYIAFTWVFFLLVSLWLGNRLINKYLNRFFNWRKYNIWRFFLQLFLLIIYALLIINISYLLFKNLFTNQPPTPSQVFTTNVFGALILLPIISIYFGIYFLRAWIKANLESEKMKKENAKAELKALKNHLDPHFLFNNLNVLSALIEIDTEASQAFLDKFAEVYRTMLNIENQELVSLKEELEFLDAYCYLLKIRFENNILIKINIPEALKTKSLPPLSLQMLIENAIKHNLLTQKKPLIVTITSEEKKYLTVQNNFQAKTIQMKTKSGSGLHNIQSRYAFFTKRKVEIEQTELFFTVRIPLLSLKNI